jgi:hypothetical protein
VTKKKPAKRVKGGARGRKNNPNLLTAFEMDCVLLHRGNDTEAYEAAGGKDGAANANRLFKRPRVQAALAKKQDKRIEFSAKIDVIGKSEIVKGMLANIRRLEMQAERCIKSKNLQAHAKVCDSLASAWEKLSEESGFKVRLSADLTSILDAYNDEEKRFFLEHGYWPKRSPEPERSGYAGCLEAAVSHPS